MAGSLPIGNGARESALQGASVDGRRLGSYVVVHVDAWAAKAVLVVRCCRVTPKGAGDDRRRQRSVAQLLRRRKRSVGVGCSRERPDATFSRGNEAEHRVATGRSWSGAVKRGANRGRIVARRFGATRNVRSARARGFGFESGWAQRPRGLRGASCVLGHRTIHGCSCRTSIADVGEKHLSRATEGSREANRGGAG